MQSGPARFSHTPVCKVLLLLCALCTFLTTSLGLASSLLSYEAVWREWQLWRLPAASLCFHSTPEALSGLFLLYFFRLFERQLGSTKYAFFLVFSLGLSALLQALLLGLLGAYYASSPSFQPPAASSTPSASSLASEVLEEHSTGSVAAFVHLGPACGPFGLIFASFVLFAADVPVTTRLTLFSRFRFSDKTLLYVAGLQLFFSSWLRSIIPALFGLLAGLLYHLNVAGLRKLRFPDSAATTAAHVFSFLLASPPSPVRGPSSNAPALRSVAPATLHLRPGQQDTGVAGAGEAPSRQAGSGAGPRPGLGAPIEAAPAESVLELMAMGFERDLAIQALQHANNDVTLATNLLLESQTYQ